MDVGWCRQFFQDILSSPQDGTRRVAPIREIRSPWIRRLLMIVGFLPDDRSSLVLPNDGERELCNSYISLSVCSCRSPSSPECPQRRDWSRIGSQSQRHSNATTCVRQQNKKSNINLFQSKKSNINLFQSKKSNINLFLPGRMKRRWILIPFHRTPSESETENLEPESASYLQGG